MSGFHRRTLTGCKEICLCVARVLSHVLPHPFLSSPALCSNSIKFETRQSEPVRVATLGDVSGFKEVLQCPKFPEKSFRVFFTNGEALFMREVLPIRVMSLEMGKMTKSREYTLTELL